MEPKKEQMMMTESSKEQPSVFPVAGLVTPAPQVRNAPMVETTRHGGAGMCAACGDWIINHFDAERPRVFIGCANPNVTDSTVFTMVPIETSAPVVAGGGQQQRGRTRTRSARKADDAGDTHKRNRKFYVARHYLRLPPGKTAYEIARPGSAKDLVVRFLQQHQQDGALAREIRKGTKLDHGPMSAALQWLRDHELVESVETHK